MPNNWAEWDKEHGRGGDGGRSADKLAAMIKGTLGHTAAPAPNHGSHGSVVHRTTKKDLKRPAPVKGEKDRADSMRTRIRMAAYYRKKAAATGQDPVDKATPRTEQKVNPHEPKAPAPTRSADKLAERVSPSASNGPTDHQRANHYAMVADRAQRASDAAKTESAHLSAAKLHDRAAELAVTEGLRNNHQQLAENHRNSAEVEHRAQQARDRAAADRRAQAEESIRRSKEAQQRLAQRQMPDSERTQAMRDADQLKPGSAIKVVDAKSAADLHRKAAAAAFTDEQRRHHEQAAAQFDRQAKQDAASAQTRRNYDQALSAANEAAAGHKGVNTSAQEHTRIAALYDRAAAMTPAGVDKDHAMVPAEKHRALAEYSLIHNSALGTDTAGYSKMARQASAASKQTGHRSMAAEQEQEHQTARRAHLAAAKAATTPEQRFKHLKQAETHRAALAGINDRMRQEAAEDPRKLTGKAGDRSAEKLVQTRDERAAGPRSDKPVLHTAIHNGETFTRSSKSEYTHAGIYHNSYTGKNYATFHGSAAAAAHGSDGKKPLAVVPVTRGESKSKGPAGLRTSSAQKLAEQARGGGSQHLSENGALLHPEQFRGQGVQKDSDGHWMINHGGYGAHQGGVPQLVSKSGQNTPMPGMATWSVSAFNGRWSGTRGPADAVWANRDAISKVVKDSGVKGHVRLDVHGSGDVHNYDTGHKIGHIPTPGEERRR